MKNLNINIKAVAILSGVVLASFITDERTPKAIFEPEVASVVDINKFEVEKEEIKDNIVSTCHINDEQNVALAESQNDNTDTIIISFAGDCTLGNDKKVTYFDDMVSKQQNDYSYFFKNVSDIFKTDDYTLVNLETTFTDATQYAEKQFNFKGDYEYVNILKEGNIEGVNISNNHTKDYLEKGYTDTINTLEKANIDYSGDDYIHIENIKNIKVGFVGFKNAKLSIENIDDKLTQLKKYNPEIIVASCHWGIEGTNEFNSEQQEFAHYLIDNGVDIVVGHHPHVLQGIEEYKDRHIIYSLGNFCFGGNSNPKDKDSMIVQESFSLKNGELINNEIKIIPCSISSVPSTNNFQPTPLSGDEKERVLNKVLKHSYNFEY